jgi:uncharacterized RDD family membrane protein YckC
MIQWVERAGFWPRAAAGATDLFVALILYLIVIIVIAPLGQDPDTATSLMGGVWCVLWLLYSGTEALFAGTPGRLLLGQRIARQNGLRADKWRLFLRWSTKQSPVIVGLIGAIAPSVAFTYVRGLLALILGIGLLGILNDDHLSWHDEWSGTAVWRTRRIAPPPLPHVPPSASAMSW